MTLRVEDLLAKGDKLIAWGLLDFGKFGINDGDRFSFGRDVGMLGLQLGEQGLQVSDRALHFQISGIIILSPNLIALDRAA